MPYLTGSPWWMRKIYDDLVWQMPATGNKIYLSFDDGPHPEVTTYVLDLLKAYHASSSFFCIGNNVDAYPEIYKRILDEGHVTGNHSYDHLNGWKTDDKAYVENIKKASKIIHSNLFRPPYGRMKKSQIRELKNQFPGMKIIMWSVLSGDFDTSIDGEKCFDIVRKKTSAGSIIVFHDSEKAFGRLKICLPKVLAYFSGKGYVFDTLSPP